MYTALIIEDEDKSANVLKLMIQNICDDINILTNCTDLPSGVRAIKKLKPDLVFLDIEMPGFSGLQLLEFFNEEEINFEIIFTTAYSEFAIKAFELSAIDYLLKPIQESKLSSALERFRKKENKQKQSQQLDLLEKNLLGDYSRIAFPIQNGFEIINVNDIVYIEAFGSYCKVYLKNEPNPLVISKLLKLLEDILVAYKVFLRIHRSFVVNISYIKKIVKSGIPTMYLTNNVELPVSIERIDMLLEQINKQ